MSVLLSRRDRPVGPSAELRGPRGASVSGAVIAASTAAAGLVTAAVVVRLLWSAERGLDFSDEGMYLLSADPGRDGVAFHNAFGRWTGLLHAAVGRDLVRFRVAGVLLLVLVAAWAGRRAVLVAARLRDRPPGPAEQAVVVVAMVAAALHYYVLLLVTPSYNWLNLVGLLVGAAAGAELLTRPEPTGPARWWWPSVLALGVATAGMGRLASAPILLGSVGLGLLRGGPGRRQRLAPMVRTAPAFAVLAVLHALLVDPWSTTLRQIRRGSQLLAALDPEHYSVGAALGEVVRAVGTVVAGSPGVLGAGLVVALAGGRWCRADPTRDRRRPLVATAATLVLGVSAAGVGTWHGGTAGYGSLAWASVMAAAVGLVALASAPPRWDRPRRVRALTVAVVGLAAAAAYPFGSNNGFFTQAGAALPLVVAVAAGAVLVARPGREPAGGSNVALLPLVALAGVLALGAASLVDGAIERPYRQPPLAAATVPVDVGGGRGTVRLAAPVAEQVAALRAAAERAGWRRGTPLLDLSWYSASTVYLLGADPPPTAIVSVGGFAHVDDLAERSLRAAAAESDRWGDAWVLTTIGPPAPGQAPDPQLLRLVGRRFPDDYRSLGTFSLPAGAVELWRPR